MFIFNLVLRHPIIIFMRKINLAIVDDQKLFVTALSNTLEDFGFSVIIQAYSGSDLIEKLKLSKPDLVLMDVSMPIMGGVATTHWLKQNMPDVSVIALSMYDDTNLVQDMLRAGAKGYLLKGTDPEEVAKAINEVLEYDRYISDFVREKMYEAISKAG